MIRVCFIVVIPPVLFTSFAKVTSVSNTTSATYKEEAAYPSGSHKFAPSPVFSVVRVAQSLVLCVYVVLYISMFGYGIFCTSSIDGFWWFLWGPSCLMPICNLRNLFMLIIFISFFYSFYFVVACFLNGFHLCLSCFGIFCLSLRESNSEYWTDKRNKLSTF